MTNPIVIPAIRRSPPTMARDDIGSEGLRTGRMLDGLLTQGDWPSLMDRAPPRSMPRPGKRGTVQPSFSSFATSRTRIREFRLDDVPEQSIVDTCVAVNQFVPEFDDATVLAYPHQRRLTGSGPRGSGVGSRVEGPIHLVHLCLIGHLPACQELVESRLRHRIRAAAVLLEQARP